MGIYINASKALKQRAIQILSKATSNLFRVKFKIFSTKNDQVQVIPGAIEKWEIIHDFDKEYHEKMNLVINVSMEEAQKLIENSEGLRANIAFERVDQHYKKPLTDVKQEVKQYIVLISSAVALGVTQSIAAMKVAQQSNPTDTKYNDDNIRSARHKLSVDFIEDLAYKFSKLPLNNINHNTTVQGMVHHIANALGIEKVDMAKPDNPTKYKQVLLPPMQTLETLDNLQKERGIYAKGLGYYYMDGTLSVYPEFDTDRKQTATSGGELHLYRLPVDELPGAHSYYITDEGNTTHLVLNRPSSVAALSDFGVDKSGNYAVTRRTDAWVDTDTTAKGKEATVNKNNGLSVTFDEVAVQQGITKARYVHDTNNPLAISSDMAAYLCNLLTVEWPMAWPWTIKPGQKVIYYYDNGNGIDTIPGIVAGVSYSLAAVDGWPMASKGQFIYYAWSAVLTARLAANPTPENVANNMSGVSEDTKKAMEAAANFS